MIAFLGARAVAGVERVSRERYARTIELDGRVGSVEVRPGRGHLVATIRFPEVRALLSIVARLRRLFDLDADVETIGAHLAGDRRLAPLVARRPGLRTPGSWDGFELAVRAVLGQQVSVGAARRLAAAVVARAGTPVARVTGDPGLTHTFPTAARVAAADLSTMPMPRTRIAALTALARAAAAEPRLLEPVGTSAEVVERLMKLPGFGPWTAQYWALRALRDSDAFPAADVGLLRSAVVARGGMRPTPAALLARAERWRPWRAYAAQHLWASGRDAAHA
jgi:AraC family transcriptional regulator of adaptative response / DNA-3-methyladenine glycosylase II